MVTFRAIRIRISARSCRRRRRAQLVRLDERIAAVAVNILFIEPLRNWVSAFATRDWRGRRPSER